MAIASFVPSLVPNLIRYVLVMWASVATGASLAAAPPVLSLLPNLIRCVKLASKSDPLRSRIRMWYPNLIRQEMLASVRVAVAPLVPS